MHLILVIPFQYRNTQSGPGDDILQSEFHPSSIPPFWCTILRLMQEWQDANDTSRLFPIFELLTFGPLQAGNISSIR